MRYSHRDVESRCEAAHTSAASAVAGASPAVEVSGFLGQNEGSWAQALASWVDILFALLPSKEQRQDSHRGLPDVRTWLLRGGTIWSVVVPLCGVIVLSEKEHNVLDRGGGSRAGHLSMTERLQLPLWARSVGRPWESFTKLTLEPAFSALPMTLLTIQYSLINPFP